MCLRTQRASVAALQSGKKTLLVRRKLHPPVGGDPDSHHSGIIAGESTGENCLGFFRLRPEKFSEIDDPVFSFDILDSAVMFGFPDTGQ